MTTQSARSRIALLLTSAIMVAGALAIWWTVAETDRRLRADLLQQARVAAQSLSVERIQMLSGKEVDLTNPEYERIKERLATICSANPQCRFLYLMGRQANGTIFFFVDSELPTSKDYSPPGLTYAEVPASDRHVFDTMTATVTGPTSDRWGAWVSALVPLTDPRTGALVAVLGLDIDARTWMWDVAARAALPVGATLVLLIVVAAAFASTRRSTASPKPVLWRLLPPLAGMVILLMAGAGVLLWQQQEQKLAESTGVQIAEVATDLSTTLDEQAAALAMALHLTGADPNLPKALRAHDTASLLAAWQPVFETLRQQYHITDFSFLDRDRVSLLRIHDPQKRGDRIEDATVLKAEQTGQVASGIELGPQGALILRVVQPVSAGGTLVGYVEMGKEIEDVLETLHQHVGVELAVVIDKEHLDRQSWEDGMRRLGRQPDWDRLPRSAVAYASQSYLPDPFALRADQSVGSPVHGATDQEVALDGKEWRVSTLPLLDASGTDVGDLLILSDITAEKSALTRLMLLGGTANAVLLALLLGSLYVLLRRTDAGILAQQAALRESEQSYRNQFANNSAVMLLVVRQP